MKAAKAVKGMVAKPAAELGEASGAADDWMRGEACIRFVYTFELPDFGQRFWPDKKHIWPTANQVRNSIDIMLKHIHKLVKKERKKGKLKKKWCDMSGNGSNSQSKTEGKRTRKQIKYIQREEKLYGVVPRPNTLPTYMRSPYQDPLTSHYGIVPGPYALPTYMRNP